MILLQSFFAGILAITTVLATSEIGHYVQNVSDFNYTVSQLDWYRYPIKIQRMLVPVLIFVQKPVVIQFFGSFSSSREQFKKVRFVRKL